MALRSYLSLTTFKLEVGDTSTSRDTVYRRVCEGIAGQIDNWTKRVFQPYTATNYYTATWMAMADYAGAGVETDDLLSVTSLAEDRAQDRAYSESWTSSNFELYPWNAPNRQEPYRAIFAVPNGSQRFVDGIPRGVRVAGLYGYWLETFAVAETLSTAAAITATSTSIGVSTTVSIEPLQTILVDSEQMYVKSAASTTLLVERAVNGTSASTHAAASGITVYRYPGPIVEAAVIQAQRIHRRKDAPFGVVGAPDLGPLVPLPPMDQDVKQLLSPYRLYTWLAV